MIKAHKKHLIRRCEERGWTLEEVMDCVRAQDGDVWIIDEKHPSYPMEHKNAKKSAEQIVSEKFDIGQGVGTELKKLLSMVGLKASPSCPCNQRAKTMNQNGLQWCKDNKDTIVLWLEEEAKKRRLPFLKFGAKKLVNFAIKKYEKKESKA